MNDGPNQHERRMNSPASRRQRGGHLSQPESPVADLFSFPGPSHPLRGDPEAVTEAALGEDVARPLWILLQLQA